MHLKSLKLLSLSLLLFSSTAALADKPEWAGNGEKASKYEKEEHKEEMTSKHEYKKDKREKDKKKKKKNKKNNHYDDDRDYGDVTYRKKYDSREDYRGQAYEGQGLSDSEFIEEKKDETKKNWIGKFFNFLN